MKHTAIRVFPVKQLPSFADAAFSKIGGLKSGVLHISANLDARVTQLAILI
jgi:hypothetical protein